MTTRTNPRPAKKHHLKARTGVTVAAAVVLAWGGPAANAYWQTLTSTVLTTGADSILAVGTPGASAAAGVVSVSWQRGTTVSGRPVTGYTVARYPAATDGASTPAGGGCAGTITTLGCTETGLPDGTWHYAVTPVFSSWQGPESARSGAILIDTTAPKPPVINAPTYINSSTSGTVDLSGTAEPGATVRLTVTDTATPKSTLPLTATANPSGQWTTPSANLTSFSDGTITFSATAADSTGNTSDAATATSTKDVSIPTVTGVTLSNGGSKSGKLEPGDKVTIKFSKTLSPGSICSNWAPLDTTQTVNGPDQVTVFVSSTNNLTLSVASSACPTPRFGTVALGGSYYGSGNLTFGGTTAPSSLSWNPGTRELTVTLGGIAAGNPGNANQKAGTPRYTPAPGLSDAALNLVPTTQVAGTPDSNF